MQSMLDTVSRSPSMTDSCNPPTKLQGWKPELSDRASLERVLELALDYRGDVTLVLVDGSQVTGYLFNRDAAAKIAYVELYASTQTNPIKIKFDDIQQIEFSGKDTAAGKSWQVWLETVAEAERQGKIAELYPEELG